MKQRRIRRTSSNYVGAVNNSQYMDFNIHSTFKPLLQDKSVANVNLNTLFMSERLNCKNFRLMLTINPYCTNVLFNPCTEITYIDKDNKMNAITHNSKYDFDVNDSIQPIGKDKDLTPYDMIRNTEYSSEKFNFQYHPGLDIFNNHILRNKSYRIVNKLNSENEEDKRKFNTIEDYFRLYDGSTVKKYSRLYKDDLDDTTYKEKHLYDREDILPYTDSIKENLKEQDGWFGFYNTSIIESKDEDGNNLDINRVINNKGNCQFIDMYPDRTTFSFAPQYNTHRNRVEYNWDVLLTYPFESTTTFEKGGETHNFHVIESDGRNGLFIVDAKMLKSNGNSNVVLFRTLTKHNLQKDDYVHLYFNENNNGIEESVWYTIKGEFIVFNVGDEEGKNEDYYFSINNTDFLTKVFCTPKKNEIENNLYSSWDYVRDYFYKEFTINDISVISLGKEYKLNELIRTLDNKIYICSVDKCINDGTSDTFLEDNFSLLDDVINVYVYNSNDKKGGLTEFPSSNDMYIKVIDEYDNSVTYYTFFNHDIQELFIDNADTINSMDFLMGIVNNAFRTEDGIERDYDSNDGLTHKDSNKDGVMDKDFDNDGLIDDINGDDKSDFPRLWNDYISFRMVKVDSGVEVKYYVRKFKKLGLFNKEYYKLAYANTIYGDEISQLTYTDTINIEGLQDNLGRDISELYVTIIKANRGHKAWYYDENDDDDNNYDNINIEKSHCFGPVTCGFDFHTTLFDSTHTIEKRLGDYDIKMLKNNLLSYYSELDEDNIENSSKFLSGFGNKEVTSEDEWFYGDIVEFNPVEYTETVLSDVNFRFNSVQRELNEQQGEGNYCDYCFLYDEIKIDDFEGDEFEIGQNEINNINKYEGYYYKPHYKIRLQGISELRQGNHRNIFINNVVPYQQNGMFIRVNTRIKHNLTQGNKVILKDNYENHEWILDVVTVLNNYSFIINKIDKNDNNYQDWVTICDKLNQGICTIKALNENIPSYAVNIGDNMYMWRDTIGLWEDNNPIELPYTNNSFYIDDVINFYLKRQNPDGSLNAYFENNPEDVLSDIEGLENNEPSNYRYIPEDKYKC